MPLMAGLRPTSSSHLRLELPRARNKQWADRSSAATAERIAPDIGATTDISFFKSKLKTHFFTLSFYSV